MWASLTTYCKWGGQENVEWYNWIVCGMCYGLSALPVAIAQNNYKGFALRVLTLMSTIWLMSDSGVVRGVVGQEMGRGALFVGTLIMMRRKR